MDAEEAQTVGQLLRRIRKARRMPLDVVAGLAGMSKSKLDRIERGEVALDRVSDIIALANALKISPSNLMRVPVPAPANGHTDSAINAVFLAMMAARRNRPGGEVVPVEGLRARVAAMVMAHYRCDPTSEIGARLPSLIRDLHTSIAAGKGVAELLDLAVLLHSTATGGWLRMVSPAPFELREMAADLAFRAAEQRDTPEARTMAVWGGLAVMLASGASDLAQAELDSVSVSTSTSVGMQLEGTLALCRSALAAVTSRPGDIAMHLEYAAELAARSGEATIYGLGFGLQEIGQWRMWTLMEAGEPAAAARIMEGLQLETLPFRLKRADGWVSYGRALARLRGRHDDAVRALCNAERISPHVVLRSPIIREVLGELIGRTRRDSPADRELRGMVYRADLLPPSTR